MLGMSEAEFWATTPRYFRARLRGFKRNRQFTMEVARFNAFFVLKTKYENRIRKMSDVIKFQWEKHKPFKAEPIDPEALEKFSREADIIFERMMAEKNKTADGKHS